MIKNLLYLGFLFCIANTSFSQTISADATIILNDNTIKYGTLKYGDWERTPDNIHFKPAQETSYITYSPADIKSFLVNGIKYISGYLLTDNTPVITNDLYRELKYDTMSSYIFIKEIASGKKNLYEYVSAKGIHNFYIKNNRDSIELLIYKRYIDDNSQIEMIEKYKNQLTFYFSDCWDMLPQIKPISYNEKSLIHIFEVYNACKGNNAVQLKKEKLKYSLDVLGGLTYGNTKFSGPDDLLFSGSQYKSFASYAFLISLGLPIAKKFQRRHLVAELGTKNINITGSDSVRGGLGAYYLTHINLKYSYLKANLLYRHYLISNNILAVFGNLGFSFGYAIRSKGQVENLTKGFIYKDYYGVNKTDAGIIIGGGVCINKIMTNIQYEQGNILTINSTVRSNTKMIYLLVGYRIF